MLAKPTIFLKKSSNKKLWSGFRFVLYFWVFWKIGQFCLFSEKVVIFLINIHHLMGTRTGFFWDSRTETDDGDFGLCLRMNQQQHKHQLDHELSPSPSPRKKLMTATPMPSNQPGFGFASSYDVVSGSALNLTEGPFTAAQRQELQRQSLIFKYMVASVPVPPELLVPIPKTNHISKVGRGSIEVGMSGNSDQEPWRCRRTDGKKWRCSRDVAPEQRYCERHTHKGRPRSRKPVELNSDFTDKNIGHNKTCLKSRADDRLCSFPSAGYDQPRYLNWFNHGMEQNEHRGSIGGGPIQTQTQETTQTRLFIDAWSTPDGVGNEKSSVSSTGKSPFSSLTLSMSGGEDTPEENGTMQIGIGGVDRERFGELKPNWMSPVSWMDSPPGGPLAEVLCLGISGSGRVAPTSSPRSTTEKMIFF